MLSKRSWQTVGLLATAVLLVLACAGVALPSASTAEESLPWRAEYFDNPSLTGTPARVRNERAIDFNWGHGRPDSGVPVDYFSARWTAYLYFDGGLHVFKAYVDDGVRLWVDGQLIIDEWRNQDATLFERQADVSTGYHSVRVEYYEHIGNAIAMVWWDRIPGAVVPSRWRAEYFNNPWLVGQPVLTRDETAVSYNWGTAAPAPGVAADGFSIRWTGNLGFDYSGTYTFTLTADDGARVWIDGGLLNDLWGASPGSTVVAARYLTQGTHPIIVEYFDGSGTASINLSWGGAGGPGAGVTPGTPTLTPTAAPSAEIIVDDRSAGFQKGGPIQSWYESTVGYSGHTFWTYNSDAQVYNFAKWVPQLPRAGNYEVFAFIPRQHADTKSARYRIYHSGQENATWLNQSTYFDKWASLGTFYFAASGNEYVYLDDVTGEAYASRKIAFDAVKFVSTDGVALTATPVRTSTPIVATATPRPPTQTPIVVTVTPGPPTTTPIVPTPGPTLPSCAIMPILGFGNLWTNNATVRDRIGCPMEIEKNTWSAEETFVHGYMLWRGDLPLIYALYNDGTWQHFDDTWHEGDLEWDPTITPPAGYYQPKRGFGKVWREKQVNATTSVRDKLGWATTTERGLGASWQAYERGLMVWSDVHGIFVIYSDGTWSLYH